MSATRTRRGVSRGPDGAAAAAPTSLAAALEVLERERREKAALLAENGLLRVERDAAVAQQAATTDVLRVIAGGPVDLQAVLGAIADRVVALCDSSVQVEVRRPRSDGQFERVAANAYRPDAPEAQVEQLPRFQTSVAPRLLTEYLGPAAMVERRTLHLPDIRVPEAATRYPGSARVAHRLGVRTMAAVPLLRHGEALGAIYAVRGEVRPFTPQELTLLETFADQAVVALENARLFRELRQRDERRRVELERAAAIQQRLLPERVAGWPGVLEVAVRFRPAVETSGDFFDVLRLSPSTEGALPPLQIAVGDVAGKGMAAALVTALARTALRSTAAVPTQLATPANTLRLAGTRLHDDVGSGHFVACALAVVEPPGRHHAGPLLRLANAAQVPVLLVRAGQAREVEPPGYRLPLGTEDDGAYEDAKVELRAGDVVVFSSDGLVEAPALPAAIASEHLLPPAKTGEMFGFGRLSACASHWSAHAPTAEDAAAGIWADLTAWCGEESHHDDMTLLVLRVPG